MIDTHAHIYLPEFEDDKQQVIKNAREAGVKTILLPAIDSGTHTAMLKLEEEFKECVSMIGLHPCSIRDDFKPELEIVCSYLDNRPFIAIGEIGLDFHWNTSFSKQQYEAFHQQIQIAIKQNLPIVIHSRKAIDECIEVVSQYPGSRGVFHCFSGNEEQAKKIIDLNFMLGIGGVITFKNAGLDRVIKEVGIENIILETDAPYLAPVPYRGKRNEPAFIKLIAEKLSFITENTIEEIKQITTANAMGLFDLK